MAIYAAVFCLVSFAAPRSAAAQHACTNALCEDFLEFGTSSQTMSSQFSSNEGFVFTNKDGNNQYLYWFTYGGETYDLASAQDDYWWNLPFPAKTISLTYRNTASSNEQDVEFYDTNDNLMATFHLDPSSAFRAWWPNMCFQNPVAYVIFPGNTTGSEVFVNQICAFTCQDYAP